jgi:hypothetical protein
VVVYVRWIRLLVAGTVGWPGLVVARKTFGWRTFRWPGLSGPELSMAGSFLCQGLLVAGTFLAENFGGLDV